VSLFGVVYYAEGIPSDYGPRWHHQLGWAAGGLGTNS
jgi:hypothetical protein